MLEWVKAMREFVRTDCLLWNFFCGFGHFYESFRFSNELIPTRQVQFTDNEGRRFWYFPPEVLCHAPSHDANADKSISGIWQGGGRICGWHYKRRDRGTSRKSWNTVHRVSLWFYTHLWRIITIQCIQSTLGHMQNLCFCCCHTATPLWGGVWRLESADRR